MCEVTLLGGHLGARDCEVIMVLELVGVVYDPTRSLSGGYRNSGSISAAPKHST